MALATQDAEQFTVCRRQALLRSGARRISKTTAAPEGFLVPGDSALVSKYLALGKSYQVLIHLHVHALQQQVYLDLCRPDLYERERAFYEQYLPDYLDSWTIVESEGRAPFIDEVRQVLRDR